MMSQPDLAGKGAIVTGGGSGEFLYPHEIKLHIDELRNMSFICQTFVPSRLQCVDL